MKYSAIKFFDIANGPGVRVTLFVSGCTRHCPYCFNADTWDFNSGEQFTQEVLDSILKALESNNIDGLSILGGEPFEPLNVKTVSNIANKVKQRYPNKSIWVWTGYTYEELRKRALAIGQDYSANYTQEELLEHALKAATDQDYYTWRLLKLTDVLVDGPFEQDNKSLLLRFRGSSNQRILDLAKMNVNELSSEIIEWKDQPIYASHTWPSEVDANAT